MRPDQVRHDTIQGMVDSGATKLVLLQAFVKRLGLPLGDPVTVRYADGRPAQHRQVKGVSDLLIRGILIWDRDRGFGLAADRVHESQIGARICELGRVEVLQQMSDCAVGPRVRHRMDLHPQHAFLQIRGQVGL